MAALVSSARRHLPCGQSGSIVLRPGRLHPFAHNVAKSLGIGKPVDDLTQVTVCVDVEGGHTALEPLDDGHKVGKPSLESLEETLDIDAYHVVRESPLQQLLSAAQTASQRKICEIVARMD